MIEKRDLKRLPILISQNETRKSAAAVYCTTCFLFLKTLLARKDWADIILRIALCKIFAKLYCYSLGKIVWPIWFSSNNSLWLNYAKEVCLWLELIQNKLKTFLLTIRIAVVFNFVTRKKGAIFDLSVPWTETHTFSAKRNVTYLLTRLLGNYLSCHQNCTSFTDLSIYNQPTYSFIQIPKQLRMHPIQSKMRIICYNFSMERQ